MRPRLLEIEGVMAMMPFANINTDAIIPADWLRSPSLNLGEGLFARERYDAEGHERPEFILNQPMFRQARILLADENFGCGSSREAAVWALVGFGIRCVLAPSFADIFYENAFRNALLPGIIDVETARALAETAQRHKSSPVFRIELARSTITGPDQIEHPFRVPEPRANALMRGDDEVGATLRFVDDIEQFHERAKSGRAWLYQTMD